MAKWWQMTVKSKAISKLSLYIAQPWPLRLYAWPFAVSYTTILLGFTTGCVHRPAYM